MSIMMKSLVHVHARWPGSPGGADPANVCPRRNTEETAETKGRAVAVEIEAEVTAIDLKTREVTLRGPDGVETTFHAPEKLVKLEDVSVGDRVVGTFFAALEGEMRTPTAEELAEPWVEMQGKSVSADAATPWC